jgi:hypothetical protein
MSDAELIARLRDWEEHDEGKNNDAREAAADRIEEVVKERDDLGRKLNTARYGQPDFAWSIHEEAMADLRAKLTKAVEVLRETTQMLSQCTFTNGQYFERRKVVDKANAALAELEGETK